MWILAPWTVRNQIATAPILKKTQLSANFVWILFAGHEVYKYGEMSMHALPFAIKHRGYIISSMAIAVELYLQSRLNGGSSLHKFQRCCESRGSLLGLFFLTIKGLQEG